MTTFTSLQAATTYPIYKPVGSRIKCVAYGTIAVAANPVAADIYQMCWLPAGALVLGGMVQAADLDTGTEALDMDLGWAANGASGTYDAADPDGFGNYGVWEGDLFATGNISRVAGNNFILAGAFLAVGVYPAFTKNTLVQFVANVTANSFTAGQLSCHIDYIVP